jgi:hypothetical protein
VHPETDHTGHGDAGRYDADCDDADSHDTKADDAETNQADGDRSDRDQSKRDDPNRYPSYGNDPDRPAAEGDRHHGDAAPLLLRSIFHRWIQAREARSFSEVTCVRNSA